MALLRSSVLVAGGGGVGKTLVARLLVAARPGCRPVGFDREDGSASAFARLLLADRIPALDLVSDLGSVSPAAAGDAMAPFDRVGEAILVGHAVIDSGTKAARGMAVWARAAGGGEFLRSELAPVHVVVPTVATAVSVRAARDAVERLGARGALDAYPPVIVFNGLHGEFDEIVGNADLAWLQSRVEAGRAKCVVMPRCRGSVMRFVAAERLGFGEALAIDPSGFARRFDVPEDLARQWLRCFADFAADVLGGLAAAGLGREPVEERQRLLDLDRACRGAAFERLAVPNRLAPSDPDIAVEALRRVRSDLEAARRVAEGSTKSAEGRADIQPRLGRYRRDVVLEAERRGIDPESHRVAAVSYIHDLQDLGWRGAARALRFLGRYHAETMLMAAGLLRRRSWPPALY